MRGSGNDAGLGRGPRAAGMGALAGLLVLLCLIAPWQYRSRRAAVTESRHQRNLVAASGEAAATYPLYRAEIAVQVDGAPVPDTDLCVSFDRRIWYVPREGRVWGEVPAGLHTVYAGWRNRTAYAGLEVTPAGGNQITLDLGRTPAMPEVQSFTLAQGESTRIPLEVLGADRVEHVSPVSGIRFQREGEGFYLEVDGSQISGSFYHLMLKAENRYGYTLSSLRLFVHNPALVVEISTVEELAGIRNDLGGNYRLVADLDFSDLDHWPGIGSSEYPFTGTFDGGGHEITGFRTSGEQYIVGLVHYGEQAVFRNLVIREPVVDCTTEGPLGCGMLLASASLCYIENCAVIGGTIRITSERNTNVAGLFNGNRCVAQGCYNSADIKVVCSRSQLPNVGGITAFGGHNDLQNCANEGEIRSDFVTGGIGAQLDESIVRDCYNTGRVIGNVLVGEFPAGGIAQAYNRGVILDCLYAKDRAATGMGESTVINLRGLYHEEFRDEAKLGLLGAFTGESPQWAWASLDAYGPMPYGVFGEQAPAPEIRREGGAVTVPPRQGQLYFYATDGSDPRITCVRGVDQVEVTLRPGQELRVFAAARGMRDSDIVIVTGGSQ